MNRKTQEIQWLKEEKYKNVPSKQLKKDIERLQKGEHVDYVIGFVEFVGCKIDLAYKPFIPRPETEYWVKNAIEEILITKKRVKCLDIFSGSGCIGVAVLKNIPFSSVDFAEKDKRFIKQIQKNAKENNISSARYKVIQSDVFWNVIGSYDYIFANPPYIAESRKEKVQKSVIKNDPAKALFGGKDGLRYIKKFLKEAKKHLNPEGTIYMEFDSFEKNAIDKMLRDFGYAQWKFFKDQYKKYRYVVINV